MRALVIPAFAVLSACGPKVDCVTPGGMAVAGYSCEVLAPIQRVIEAEIEAAGYGPNALAGVTVEVTPYLVGTSPRPYVGWTYCPHHYIAVTRKAPTPWSQWDLAHEAFHIAQNCSWDEPTYQSCRRDGGDHSTCEDAAQHANWDTEVKPHLRNIHFALRELPENWM